MTRCPANRKCVFLKKLHNSITSIIFWILFLLLVCLCISCNGRYIKFYRKSIGIFFDHLNKGAWLFLRCMRKPFCGLFLKLIYVVNFVENNRKKFVFNKSCSRVSTKITHFQVFLLKHGPEPHQDPKLGIYTLLLNLYRITIIFGKFRKSTFLPGQSRKNTLSRNSDEIEQAKVVFL